jgi:hypothetical protein
MNNNKIIESKHYTSLPIKFVYDGTACKKYLNVGICGKFKSKELYEVNFICKIEYKDGHIFCPQKDINVTKRIDKTVVINNRLNCLENHTRRFRTIMNGYDIHNVSIIVKIYQKYKYYNEDYKEECDLHLIVYGGKKKRNLSKVEYEKFVTPNKKNII